MAIRGMSWDIYLYNQYNIHTKTTERLHPSGDLAFGCTACAQLAPVADLHIVRRFDNVGDVMTGVNLRK